MENSPNGSVMWRVAKTEVWCGEWLKGKCGVENGPNGNVVRRMAQTEVWCGEWPKRKCGVKIIPSFVIILAKKPFAKNLFSARSIDLLYPLTLTVIDLVESPFLSAVGPNFTNLA